MGNLTKSKVDALASRAAEYLVWDDDIAGFGLRVYPTGRKTFFVQYRVGRRSRRLKLGSSSVLTADQARTAAKKALGALANGNDPAAARRAIRNDISVAALCDLYLEEGCATKKASTLNTDRRRIARHIKPLLGKLAVREVQPADIERFLKDVATGKTKAKVRTGPRGVAMSEKKELPTGSKVILEKVGKGLWRWDVKVEGGGLIGQLGPQTLSEAFKTAQALLAKDFGDA